MVCCATYIVYLSRQRYRRHKSGNAGIGFEAVVRGGDTNYIILSIINYFLSWSSSHPVDRRASTLCASSIEFDLVTRCVVFARLAQKQQL